MVTLDGKDELIMLSQLPSVDHEPDDRLIIQRFSAVTGQDLDFKILGHWKWVPGRALVADSFGRGRVVLAGDSAHLFTPTGGFGMNTGIDDAANLGWKLAALVQGWGGEALLPSYELERRPIAFRNTGTAKLYSRNVGSLQVPPEIEEESAAGAAARAQVGRIAATFAEEFASIGIQLGARYDGSPIVVPDGTFLPSDDPFRYVPSACPGGRAPHIWLADHTSLFDLFGPGFTLLLLAGAESDGTELLCSAVRRGMPLKVLRIDEPEARDLYEANMALIRPDHHVAWRGNKLPEDVDKLLDTVVGHSM
jgi:hypothetical protein